MKIADFGLARGVHQIDYYKKTTNVSSYEVLVLMKFASLGCFPKLILEILTLGHVNI